MKQKSAILITHGTDTLAWTHAAVHYDIRKNGFQKHHEIRLQTTGWYTIKKTLNIW